jgi:hypothetical protein
MKPEDRPKAFTDSDATIQRHIDHYIDMLRQFVIHQGDVGMVSYNWVKPWGLYPDFSTYHKCRKLSPLVEWADKHDFPEEDPLPDESTVYLPGRPMWGGRHMAYIFLPNAEGTEESAVMLFIIWHCAILLK